MCTDPEEDQIFYWFDWGDGTASEWMGPYPPGLTVEASHAWENRGNYQVRVKTKDEHGSRSEWSNPLDLELSRKSLTNQYLQKGYLHVFGRPLIKTIKGNTVLIGKIHIGFNTKKTIDEVSFYVDDKLCYSDIHPPFEWLWEEMNQGYHTVTICPYINGHKINENNISVWVINF
jgi:hypothetical protein